MADNWLATWCLRLLTFLFPVLCCGGYAYGNQTQLILCEAQCEALYLDQRNGQSAGLSCNGTRSWLTSCNHPNCLGTCTVLYENFRLNRQRLEPVPNITVTKTDDRSIQLTWQPAVPTSPPHSTIYIIEETRRHQKYPSISTTSVIGWVPTPIYKIDSTDKCSQNSYRVMAVNQYGSKGYSPSVSLPGLAPGPVKNIRYVGRGVYYSKDPSDAAMSKFMAVLEWDPPAGWTNKDIVRYEWNPVKTRMCGDATHDSIPIFTPMKNHSDHILVEIAAISIGCTFQAEVKAISKCNAQGVWTDFTIDLTNCSAISAYFCQEQYRPPGNVANVTLSISSTPYDFFSQWVSTPYQVKSPVHNPLLINLHISWLPPLDLGSSSGVQNYLIRTGRAKRMVYPIPPEFIETPEVRNVSGNIVELIFQLPTQKIPYTYGVQVIAMTSNQVIPDNELGVYPMYTIQVDRNDSIAQLRQQGKILLDEAGIVIVFINNTLPVHFLFDMPEGRSQNVSSIDRYALQWGPLVGPNELFVENRTIVPLEAQVFDDGSAPLVYRTPPIPHNG